MHRSGNESSIGDVSYKLRAVGQKFIGGVSSRYEDKYDRILENVVSERELTRIIDDLNEILISYWPCTTCFLYGYICMPCTLGMSLLAPGFCASQSEQHGQKFLRNVSLTARFYDKGISFAIVKAMCDSYVEVRFPSHLASRHTNDIESGTVTSNAGDQDETRNSEISPLLNSISGGRRIKDN